MNFRARIVVISGTPVQKQIWNTITKLLLFYVMLLKYTIPLNSGVVKYSFYCTVFDVFLICLGILLEIHNYIWQYFNIFCKTYCKEDTPVWHLSVFATVNLCAEGDFLNMNSDLDPFPLNSQSTTDKRSILDLGKLNHTISPAKLSCFIA